MSPQSSFQRILIIQTAFLGDVVLATSLVEKLSLFYPDARIDFLLRKGNEGLLKGNPKIDTIIIWDKKNKLKSLWDTIIYVRNRKYDLVVNLQRFFSSGLITAFSGGKLKVGFNKNPLSAFFTKPMEHKIGKGIHEVNRNLSLISEFTDQKLVKPRLYPSSSDYEKVSGFKNTSYICIAPASVWFTKQFPELKWVEFINKIPSGIKIYLLGSPGDQSLCLNIINKVTVKNISDLSGKLSLLESAALMEGAIMNYVNDSGPMHLASAMNASVCAIYCSTVSDFGFGPLSDKSIVVETKDALTCRPCGLHGHANAPKGISNVGIILA